MLNEYNNLVIKLNNEIESYQEKPTKAASARIRKLSLQIGKEGAILRRHLIDLDKAA